MSWVRVGRIAIRRSCVLKRVLWLLRAVLSGDWRCRLTGGVTVIPDAQAALSFKSDTNVDPASFAQPVVVCTVGLGLGIGLYQNGVEVDKNVTQLTWTWPNALKRLQRKYDFVSTSPPFPKVSKRRPVSTRLAPHYTIRGQTGFFLFIFYTIRGSSGQRHAAFGCAERELAGL
jgi:hypothetical protein